MPNIAPSINLPSRLDMWPAETVPFASEDDDVLPRLTYYLPSDEFRTGQSVLILPGGGYGHVSSAKEGHRPAQFLNAHGIATAVLEYRHSPQRYPVPLVDAQRALRIVRKLAQEADGLDANRVGCMGFSAGGHLCGLVATQPAHDAVLVNDAVDTVSCHPDFFIMIYPVVSLVESFRHAGSAKNLLGDDADVEMLRALSIDNAVGPGTPPCFIAHGQADEPVPVQNALTLYAALTAHKIPATMHLYQAAAHGFGMGENHPWGRCLVEWLGHIS